MCSFTRFLVLRQDNRRSLTLDGPAVGFMIRPYLT